jgi:hypothetical protein
MKHSICANLTTFIEYEGTLNQQKLILLTMIWLKSITQYVSSPSELKILALLIESP